MLSAESLSNQRIFRNIVSGVPEAIRCRKVTRCILKERGFAVPIAALELLQREARDLHTTSFSMYPARADIEA